MADTKNRDLREEMYMHIQSCVLCTATMNAQKERKPILPPACDVGRSLSWRWLEFRAKQGDKSAQAILDGLKARGLDKRE